MANERTLDAIQKAIGAHGMWKLRLKTAISKGADDLNPDDVACDHLCDFGKWLHDDTMPARILGSKAYINIKRSHADFHKAAGNVLKTSMAGDKEAAKTMLNSEFKEKSEKLVQGLSEWKAELKASQ